jgi:hypothetical protein
MAITQQPSPQILSSSGLSQSELAPTPAQVAAIAAGCMANALRGLSAQQREGLQEAVQAVQADLSTAIDMIRQRRARMSNQLNNLQDEQSKIQGGTASISSLYVYAAPAISACPTAANAAMQAKVGSDIVHARLNEVQYQMALISETDLILASEEQELSDAMNSLDQMVLSLG